AGAAEPPEVFHRAIAGVPQRRGALPDVFQRVLADVAAGPAMGRERGTPFDGPVRLDAERRAAGAARREMSERHLPPEQRLVRTEVADVVPRPESHSCLVAAGLEPCKEREHVLEVIWLEEHRWLVRSTTHRDGELDLPAVSARPDDRLE